MEYYWFDQVLVHLTKTFSAKKDILFRHSLFVYSLCGAGHNTKIKMKSEVHL